MANNPYVNKVVYGGTTLIDISDTTATADKILEGYTAYGANGQKITGTASGQSLLVVDTVDEHGGTIRTITGKVVQLQTKTITPTSSQQVVTPDEGYDGFSQVTVNAGGSQINNQNKTVTPSESQQSVTADSGYTGLGTVTVNAISSTYVGTGITRRSATDMSGAYDKEVGSYQVSAPAGYYSSESQFTVPNGTIETPTATKGTVSNHSVSITPSVFHTPGYIHGGIEEGTAVTVSASELVSGTYSVTGSGTKDVTNYASISVPAGTAGTPTASKGTVSNHSISVTPSVTNTAGYISAGTKTGTAVTVSASELVSGSQTLTDNGTVDVTNLASVTVNIPFVTYYTGSTTPSSSLGSNGDIYLKTV